jgi:energy-coupling factor transporter ATP-binding protein EcfA2
MSNLTISSALWLGTGTLGAIWGLSQPYPSPNKFYGFGVGALAASIGTALTYPAMKKTERIIIRQDTSDQIFDIGEAAIIERYKQAVFPSPKMPDLNIYNHVLSLFPEQETEDRPPIVPFNSILDRGVGICLFGDSGSGKSSAAKYLIGLASQGSEIKLIVCDPHFDGGNDWGQDTLIVDDYDLILKCLRASLDELDNRKKLRKQGVKQFSKLVFIFDEWPSVRVAAKNAKSNICEEAVIRLGSECRKYDMLSIFCSQSGNTKAMGLEGMGDFLQNFSLIRLGKISTKHAKNLPDQRVLSCLQSAGYPCLVDDDLSIHPTHGNYTQFKNGQPPQNLLPVRTVPITLDEILGDEIYVEREQEKPKQSPATATTSPSFDIKKLDKKPESNQIINGVEFLPEMIEILELAKQNGELSIRQAYKSGAGQRLKLSSESTFLVFEKFIEARLGKIENRQIGGAIQVIFIPV